MKITIIIIFNGKMNAKLGARTFEIIIKEVNSYTLSYIIVAECSAERNIIIDVMVVNMLFLHLQVNVRMCNAGIYLKKEFPSHSSPFVQINAPQCNSLCYSLLLQMKEKKPFYKLTRKQFGCLPFFRFICEDDDDHVKIFIFIDLEIWFM